MIWIPHLCMWLLPDLVSTMNEPIFGHFELFVRNVVFQQHFEEFVLRKLRFWQLDVSWKLKLLSQFQACVWKLFGSSQEIPVVKKRITGCMTRHFCCVWKRCADSAFECLVSFGVLCEAFAYSADRRK